MRLSHWVSLIWAFVVLATLGAGLKTSSADTLRLVHMSDIHAARVDRNPTPRFTGDPMVKDLVGSLDLLRRAVDCINTQLRPDLVVITGDLVDRGNDIESLREVKSRLDRLTCPYYPIIGDHDRPAVYEKVFPGKLNYTFDRGGWHFICLDASSGKLAEKTLGWLKDDLSANRGQPTVVLLHRPLAVDPFSQFLAKKLYGAKLTLDNGAATWKLLQNFRDVRLVLSGHIHAASSAESGGIHFLTAPALVVKPHCIRLIELSAERIELKLVSINSSPNDSKQEK